MRRTSDSSIQKNVIPDILILRKLTYSLKNSRDKLLLLLFLETGCTADEITKVKPSDIEFKSNSIFLGDGSKKRRIEVSAKLGLLLTSYINKSRPYLFFTRQGDRLTVRRVEQILTSIGDSAGLKISPRELRKIVLQDTYIRTASAEVTAKKLGLKNIAEKHVLSKDDLQKIKSQIKNPQHLLMFNILSETGCRLNELVNIKSKDYDEKRQAISFFSANEKRYSPVTRKLGYDLLCHIKTHPSERYLFSTRQSERISDKRFFQVIKQYANMAGIGNVSPRILRTSSIALSIVSGCSEEDVKSKTGLKSLSASRFGVFKEGKNEN